MFLWIQLNLNMYMNRRERVMWLKSKGYYILKTHIIKESEHCKVSFKEAWGWQSGTRGKCKIYYSTYGKSVTRKNLKRAVWNSSRLRSEQHHSGGKDLEGCIMFCLPGSWLVMNQGLIFWECWPWGWLRWKGSHISSWKDSLNTMKLNRYSIDHQGKMSLFWSFLCHPGHSKRGSTPLKGTP